jgi:hypothetical protein
MPFVVAPGPNRGQPHTDALAGAHLRFSRRSHRQRNHRCRPSAGMRTLDLPTPPLPADVRERVLQTVIAATGIRAAHLLVAAAAVVVTLAVMISVALADDVTGINPLARPAPEPHQSTCACRQSSSVSTSQCVAPRPYLP